MTTATCSLSLFLMLVALDKSRVLVITVLCIFIPLAMVPFWLYPAHRFAKRVAEFFWLGLQTAGESLVNWVV